ncbi:MAG: hypothetical protein ACI9ZV_000915 [Candidatus Azotimanducaceae bacterium]|jgi:hypothetical protein
MAPFGLSPMSATMKDLIDVLPGLDLPVGEVTSRLERMWESDASGSPSAFRASQMNVVLHFGWEVTAKEAQQRFNAVLTFTQRYPSRIIVLCPSRSITDGSMRAKLFSQCYIGDSHREMCCCEALLLGYLPENCGHLGNQVSVWLEPDLPSYHWFCGVPGVRIEEYFDNLLVGVRRSIYDSSYEGEDLSDLNWPEPSRVGDLAMARLLPVRQAIGQYLSGYEISSLCEGLESVTVSHSEAMCGEGLRLMEWVKDCLGDCKQCEDGSAFKAKYTVEKCDASRADCSLSLEFIYSDGRYFKWRKFAEGSMAEIEASLGKSKEKISTRVKPLGAEQMIAEALFF